MKSFGLGFRGNLKFRPQEEGHAAMTQTNLLEFFSQARDNFYNMKSNLYLW